MTTTGLLISRIVCSQQKNHTVTQSSFADPCRPLNANGTTGFDSGLYVVSTGAPINTY